MEPPPKNIKAQNMGKFTVIVMLYYKLRENVCALRSPPNKTGLLWVEVTAITPANPIWF